jgi:hypothetical protein
MLKVMERRTLGSKLPTLSGDAWTLRSRPELSSLKEIRGQRVRCYTTILHSSIL